MNKIHKEYSPSRLARIAICKGYANRVKQTDPDKIMDGSSLPSMTGTAAHELCDLLIKEITKAKHEDRSGIEVRSPHEFLGHTFGEDIAVDTAMALGVEVYVDFVSDIARNFNEVWSERNLSLDYPEVFRGDLQGGTADFAAAQNAMGWIVDYKNGFVFVDEKDNKQLKSYALAAWYAMPEKQRLGIRHFMMTIVQPNAFGHKAIRTTTITIEALLEWRDTELKKIVSESLEASPEDLTPSLEGCQYCEVAHSCHQAADHAAKILNISPDAFTNGDIAAIENLLKHKGDDMQELTEEQQINIINGAPFVKRYLENIVDYQMYKSSEKGETPDGLMIVDKRPSKHYKLGITKKEIVESLDYFEVPMGESAIIEEEKLLTPSQLLKKIKKVLPKEKMMEFENSIIESISSGKNLVGTRMMLPRRAKGERIKFVEKNDMSRIASPADDFGDLIGS